MIGATNLGCSITCKDLEASIRSYRDAGVADVDAAAARITAAGGSLTAPLVDWLAAEAGEKRPR